MMRAWGTLPRPDPGATAMAVMFQSVTTSALTSDASERRQNSTVATVPFLSWHRRALKTYKANLFIRPPLIHRNYRCIHLVKRPLLFRREPAKISGIRGAEKWRSRSECVIL